MRWETALTHKGRRINKKTERKDFLSRILEHRDEAQISDVQIAAHASDFVLAGSETTATALSCITYYLDRTPHALKALHEEIRGAFQSYNEINASSTTPLKYLNAVIFEGMRMYPPLPFALPRVVPEGGDTVDGHILPAGVRIASTDMSFQTDESVRPLFQRIRQLQASILQIFRTLGHSNRRDGFEKTVTMYLMQVSHFLWVLGVASDEGKSFCIPRSGEANKFQQLGVDGTADDSCKAALYIRPGADRQRFRLAREVQDAHTLAKAKVNGEGYTQIKGVRRY